MATIDKIKSSLIDKIIAIHNRDFLEALDTLISSNTSQIHIGKLTNEQKVMLEMSEQDLKEGRWIPQEELEKRNLEWLNAK